MFLTNAIVRTDLGLLLTDIDFMIHLRTSGDTYTMFQGWMVDKSDQWKHGKLLTLSYFYDIISMLPEIPDHRCLVSNHSKMACRKTKHKYIVFLIGEQYDMVQGIPGPGIQPQYPAFYMHALLAEPSREMQ